MGRYQITVIKILGVVVLTVFMCGSVFAADVVESDYVKQAKEKYREMKEKDIKAMERQVTYLESHCKYQERIMNSYKKQSEDRLARYKKCSYKIPIFPGPSPLKMEWKTDWDLCNKGIASEEKLIATCNKVIENDRKSCAEAIDRWKNMIMLSKMKLKDERINEISEAYKRGDNFRVRYLTSKIVANGFWELTKSILNGINPLSVVGVNINSKWEHYRDLATQYTKRRIDWAAKDPDEILKLYTNKVGLALLKIGSKENVSTYSSLTGGGGIAKIYASLRGTLGAKNTINNIDEVKKTVEEMKKAGKIVDDVSVPKGKAVYEEAVYENGKLIKEGYIKLNPKTTGARKDMFVVHEASHAMGATEFQAFENQFKYFSKLPLKEKIKNPGDSLMYVFGHKTGLINAVGPTIYATKNKYSYYTYNPIPWR